eukprot:c11746_g1_i1.p1 GENE.c11746_g1_i1~~c11746_g1_i1.p1  ORF type:complete len:199 (-),score=34.71 c11746_g1_i1:296-892(-)
MLMRFCDNQFSESCMTTIGIDFRSRMLPVDGKQCRVQVWDTAGQERFRTITKSYLRGAHAIVMVFDCGDEETFRGIETWMTEITNNATSPREWQGKPPILCLVGNKIDKPDIKVTPKRAQDFADGVHIPFFTTSAKTGQGVVDVFEEASRRVLARQKEILEGPSGGAQGNNKSVDITNRQGAASSNAGGGCACNKGKK